MIHEKGFPSSSPENHKIGVIQENNIELHRASMLGYAFSKLGNNVTLKVSVTIHVYICIYLLHLFFSNLMYI